MPTGTLLNDDDRRQLLQRLQRVRPDAAPAWGTLTAPRMLTWQTSCVWHRRHAQQAGPHLATRTLPASGGHHGLPAAAWKDPDRPRDARVAARGVDADLAVAKLAERVGTGSARCIPCSARCRRSSGAGSLEAHASPSRIRRVKIEPDDTVRSPGARCTSKSIRRPFSMTCSRAWARRRAGSCPDMGLFTPLPRLDRAAPASSKISSRNKPQWRRPVRHPRRGLDTFAQRRRSWPPVCSCSRSIDWRAGVEAPAAHRPRLRHPVVPVALSISRRRCGGGWRRGLDSGRPAVVASTGVSMYLSRTPSRRRRAGRGARPARRSPCPSCSRSRWRSPTHAPGRASGRGARANGTPFISFFTRQTVDAGARGHFKRVQHVSGRCSTSAIRGQPMAMCRSTRKRSWWRRPECAGIRLAGVWGRNEQAAAARSARTTETATPVSASSRGHNSIGATNSATSRAAAQTAKTATPR